MSEFWIIMSEAGNLRIPVWLTNYPGDRNSDTWTHGWPAAARISEIPSNIWQEGGEGVVINYYVG